MSPIRTLRGRASVAQLCAAPATALQPHPPGTGHETAVSGLWGSRLHRRRGGEDEWRQVPDVAAALEHPLGNDLANQASGAGHGKRDWIEDYRPGKCLPEVRMDMTVSRAAALSSIVELCGKSNDIRSVPLHLAYSTCGKRKTRPPLDILRM